MALARRTAFASGPGGRDLGEMTMGEIAAIDFDQLVSAATAGSRQRHVAGVSTALIGPPSDSAELYMPESSYRDAFGRVTGQIGRFAGTIGSAIASAFTTRGSDAANATTSGYVMREERPTTAPGYEEMMQLHEDRVKVGVKDRVVAKLRRTTCSEGEVCPVCQDAAHRGIKRVALPCEHKFCEGCIIPWLKENRTCPSCRWEFPDAQVEVKR